MGGLRKRSVSESEAIDLTTKPLDGTNFGNDLNHPLFLNTRGVSNPDLSSSNSGYITTPLGAGVSTRLISGGRDEKLYNRVVQEYHTLKNQIFTYQELISDAKPTTNLADLLTKEHLLGVADVSTNSEWQEGKPWMRLATENMPIKRYSDLTVTPDIDELVKSECFDQ